FKDAREQGTALQSLLDGLQKLEALLVFLLQALDVEQFLFALLDLQDKFGHVDAGGADEVAGGAEPGDEQAEADEPDAFAQCVVELPEVDAIVGGRVLGAGGVSRARMRRHKCGSSYTGDGWNPGAATRWRSVRDIRGRCGGGGCGARQKTRSET